ncbi:uncharacterized protein TRIREDRAFT_119963 [Trichoderma reesei QM6a]|uniref:Predicted protein n=2 Tax=Hypocrea jecorina TaxID=51453 RepID=G0R7T9_HYPJQ|nr:uncharacterized protein TRIREDRAFT_119963 [Trichoderma reesei QM6a]EGR52594.1 predicted protein [Trichoderma reesei QM6a]ETR99902.1 hypothetical protein M419DRAFT_113236 [Trichoderma reesei RUT C-30]
MKFFATLLFAAAGVSAAGSATAPATPGSTCLADYILEDCLSSTTKTANSCKPTDYECLCAAYQAVLTCYNNCPNDIRAPSVQQQVDSYCRTATLLNPKTTATKAKPSQSQESSGSEETSASSPSNNDEASATDAGPSQTSGSRTSATTAATASSSTNAAATMMGSVAGIVMAVAGAAAAMV